MIDIFSYWRDQSMQSSMQRLEAENARLRREIRIKTIVYYTCMAAVLVLTMMKLYGSL